RLLDRYTDTDHDPYDAKKGFWYSHIGWLYEKSLYPRMKLVDVKDLDEDVVVRLQHEYFVPLLAVSCFLAPTILGASWGDAIGGFLYGGFVSRVAIWHVTWAINSVAHWLGDQPYSIEHTARGNLILAVLTNGEGNHNYVSSHHEFPNDYRNGIKASEYDPSKWIIWSFSKLGLAHSLIRIPNDEIMKAKVQTAEQAAEVLRQEADEEGVDWGRDAGVLPGWTLAETKRRCSEEGQDLLVIDGFILDFSTFKDRHPGGEKLLVAYRGKDATKAFYGPLNNHTKSARTILRTMRVANLVAAMQ
ncbi:hypothetical protein BDK51DRAFT_19325, partial [Blyttiomyces helicus]